MPNISDKLENIEWANVSHMSAFNTHYLVQVEQESNDYFEPQGTNKDEQIQAPTSKP